MANGRALIGALFFGHARHTDSEARLPLVRIKRLERLVLLPHDRFKLDRQVVLSGTETGTGSCGRDACFAAVAPIRGRRSYGLDLPDGFLLEVPRCTRLCS